MLLAWMLGILYPQTSRHLFAIFVIAVMISAWYGLGPGLLATFLSTLLSEYFLLPPTYSFGIAAAEDLLLLSVFAIVAVAVSVLVAARRRAEAGLRAVLDELEARVEDRTSDLIGAKATLEEEVIRRKRLHERFQSLTRLTQALTASLELPEVLDRVVRAASDLLPGSSARIWVLEGDRLHLRSEWGIRGAHGSGRKTEFALGEGLAGHVAMAREPLVVEDVVADPRIVNVTWLREQGFVSGVYVPLLVREWLVGVLVLFTRDRYRFSAEDLEVLTSFGTQAAIAIENARLYASAQERLRETEVLLSVSRALASTLDLEALLRHFLRQVARTIDADSVGAWLVDPDTGQLEPAVGYHVPPCLLEVLRKARVDPRESAFHAEGLAARRVVVSSNVPEDPRIPEPMKAIAPHQVQLFAPIAARDQVLGAFIAVWWERTRAFTDAELALVEAMGNQAGIAVENARLFQEHQRKVEELSVLYEVSRAVTGQLDVAHLLEAVRRQVGRVLDARNMVILLYEEARREFEVALRMRDGEPDPNPTRRYPLGYGLMSRVIGRRQAIRTADYLETCRREGVDPVSASLRFPYWLGVPMVAGDRVVGVLALRSVVQPFTESDQRLLANIAGLAALAIRSARLFEERTRAYDELAAAQDQLIRTEKLRALGEMASGVAHDFNNLLTSILGRTQLLSRRVEDPTLREWLQVIEQAALDGAQTVRRIQEFTRVRRDQPYVSVDLNQVVEDALEVTRPRWPEEPHSRGTTVQVVTALAPIPPVSGDPAELREALTNLILNAVDAMPEGGRLSLTTEAAGERVVVTVSDTGVGMPPDVQRRIFDPFFTTKGPLGTGLGLSMTYGIVTRHGGEISVGSSAGEGSTFRLSFPASRALPTEAATPPASSPTAALRCLVVDDEPLVREVLSDLLSQGGHEVVLVADGAEAIARCRAEPFDLVLTDLAMPGVSGLQVARAVKDHDPAVPVFVITGWGVEYSPEELKVHGVDKVLPKPVKLDDVLAAVAACGPRKARKEDVA
ncbi:MAG: GAF domain-containing protein [Candidatus Rokubacteria bacterium]|nr:GAF domain-containing protein [Candidatus Rokubacteria bacterium]